VILIDKENSLKSGEYRSGENESADNKTAGSADSKSENSKSANKRPASVRSPGSVFARMAVLIGTPVIAAIGFIYIFTFNPVSQKNLFIPCPVNLLTGMYCPGCGNTRALHALVHLDFLGMMDYNLMFPFLFFILTWLLVGEYLNLLLGRRVLWLPKRVSPILIILAAIALTAFTILRNVPIYPFTILAP